MRKEDKFGRKIYFFGDLQTKHCGSVHLPEYDSMKWYLDFLASPWTVVLDSRSWVISIGKLSIIGKSEKRRALFAPSFLGVGRIGLFLFRVPWSWVRYFFIKHIVKIPWGLVFQVLVVKSYACCIFNIFDFQQL